MTKPRRGTTAVAHEDCRRTALIPVPGTDPAQVFEAYEYEGHFDPGAAWASFTADWNWAAPLPHAVAHSSPEGAPVARPVPGGYALSGRWCLPRETGAGQWLALPLAGLREAGCQNALAIPPDQPDVFVIASKRLPRTTGGGLHAVRFPADSDISFRLEDLHVPTGFATHASGTPLSARETSFLWTAVAGMALGAARRLTEELAMLGPSPAVDSLSSAATAAAELTALLRHERLGFTAELYNRPGLGQFISLAAREPLVDRVRRAAAVAHHVVTAAYERAIPFFTKDGDHPLESLVVDSAAVLQHLRATVDLLPIEDVDSPLGG